MRASETLAVAVGELGVTEQPRGSNCVKYNDWYYGRSVSGNYPWCMAFVQWVFGQGDVKPPARTASCGTLMGAAKKRKQWVTGDYLPGDVLIYDFPGGAATDHCGICESFDGSCVTAIEGNTSVNDASNGGEVRRMRRDVSLVRGAWRPEYEEEEKMTYEQFCEYLDRYMAEREQLPDIDWGEEWQDAKHWAEETGLIRGDSFGNKMYFSLTTRQQLVMMLYRLRDLI